MKIDVNEITRDYQRLPEITRDYQRLPKIIHDYHRLLKINKDYPRLPETTRDCQRLPKITKIRGYERLPKIIRDYQGLPEITKITLSDTISSDKIDKFWGSVTNILSGEKFCPTKILSDEFLSKALHSMAFVLMVIFY